MKNTPLSFSIITPSYQQGQYIRQNIESVSQQSWTDIQHIVVDGGSKDETVHILQSYSHLEWVSEKDEGQADALNKGIALATGDIVGWVNSDDFYNANVFQLVAECFSDPAVQWVIGDLALLDEATGQLTLLSSPKVSLETLQRNPDIVRQQATFFRREFLLRAGGWDKSFYMVMDFDLWIRLAKLSTPVMLPKQLAVFRIQKDQKSSLVNLRRQTSELISVLRREGTPTINILRLRMKKEWFWLKGMLKVALVNMGLLNSVYLHKPIRGWQKN
jgi:glycosyltransferase involved in cell wall biosynthesis